MNTLSNENKRPFSAYRVCVTGATGKIGKHLVARLVADGYRVRALTSRPLTAEQQADPLVEWIDHDFRQSLDFEADLQECSAVLHLAAEIWRIPDMLRLNVEATAALARAAQASGVGYFGFTSSVAVYGSPRNRLVTESSPVLTCERDVASEYRGNPSIRAYGRSKVRAELALRKEFATIECTIMRPTVVVDLDDIRKLLLRSTFERVVLAKRHEHLIYVGDVVHALMGFMKSALERSNPQPGVSVFNLSDDECEIGLAAAFFARASELIGTAPLIDCIQAPYRAYDLLDLAKNKTISRRWPFGGSFFSSEKLLTTGYRHRHGMMRALELALVSINGDTLQRVRDLA